MLLKVLVVVLVAVSLASAVRVNFRPCAGGLLAPLWVESDKCTADRCTLTRGQVWTGRAAFVPNETFNTLQVDLKATFLGIVFPIDIPPGYEDACNFLEAGARCPVQPGTQYIWAIQAPVDNSYPAASNVVLQRKLRVESF
jgi:ML domain